MTLSAKIGGTWRTIAGAWVRVGGTWRQCHFTHVKVGGAWRAAQVTQNMSGAWPGVATPSPAVTSAVVTVPTANPGALRIDYNVSIGAPTLAWRINGGAYTNFASGTVIAVAAGDTVDIRVSGAGSTVGLSFYDNTTSTLMDTAVVVAS